MSTNDLVRKLRLMILIAIRLPSSDFALWIGKQLRFQRAKLLHCLLSSALTKSLFTTTSVEKRNRASLTLMAVVASKSTISCTNVTKFFTQGRRCSTWSGNASMNRALRL